VGGYSIQPSVLPQHVRESTSRARRLANTSRLNISDRVVCRRNRRLFPIQNPRSTPRRRCRATVTIVADGSPRSGHLRIRVQNILLSHDLVPNTQTSPLINSTPPWYHRGPPTRVRSRLRGNEVPRKLSFCFYRHV